LAKAGKDSAATITATSAPISMNLFNLLASLRLWGLAEPSR
jgi:hypothetical protein